MYSRQRIDIVSTLKSDIDPPLMYRLELALHQGSAYKLTRSGTALLCARRLLTVYDCDLELWWRKSANKGLLHFNEKGCFPHYFYAPPLG